VSATLLASVMIWIGVCGFFIVITSLKLGLYYQGLLFGVSKLIENIYIALFAIPLHNK